MLSDDLSVENEVTFEELGARVRSLACALASRCNPGERVVLALDTGLDCVELFWACIVAGLVPIPAPAPRQFMDTGFKRLQGIAADADAALVMSTAEQLDTLSQRLPLTWISREELDAPSEPRLPDVAVAGNDLAYLQYTSGSTSEPRGVELTHANVMGHCAALERAINADAPPASLLNWPPWFHDFGLVQGVIFPLYLGVTSYLMPTAVFMRRPLSWLEAIAKFKVSYSGGPDTGYLACVSALARKSNWTADLSCWSLATNGGEPVRADTMESFSRAFAPHGFRPRCFSPGYGMAESVLAVSIVPAGAPPRLLRVDAGALDFDRVQEAEEQSRQVRTLVSCGQVLDCLDVRIVDPDRHEERAPRTVGEIWVHGPSLGRGYWKKPDASALTFGARLAAEGAAGRCYLRTGDLGFVHDGQLFITGRLKDLILVHGRNIYPFDIELTARHAHPMVRPSGVIAFGIERPGGEAVVVLAECTGKPGRDAARAVMDAIRREVSGEHGVEVHEVVLLKRGTLPHTSSGKPQRSAAKRLYLEGGLGAEKRLSPREAAQPRRGPKDATERIVADAWMAVLDLDQCDVDADFFLQGGNSLIATQLVSRLNSACGVELPIRAVFEAPTIAGLAQKLRESQKRPGPLAPVQHHGSAGVADNPLSFSQDRIWFIHQQAPESAAYHMPLALRFRGALDSRALEAALNRVVDRHDILRTTFHSTVSGVEARVHPSMPISIRRGDPVRPSGSESLDQALERRFVPLASEPFDFERGPLIRADLLEIAPDDAVLLIVMHHMIGDQWSFAVLMRETAHFYRASLGIETGALPALELQYADYAAWQRRTAGNECRERDERYWIEQLDGLEPSAIAQDYPRPPEIFHRGARLRVPLDAGLVRTLTAVGARHSASLSMVMMAALKVVLQRYSGRSDISIGVPIANRNHGISEALIGTFVNILVMRTEVDRKLDFKTLLDRVRKTALDGYSHQDMPFELLVRKLKHQRDASRSPLFQVLFNMINVPVGKLDFGGPTFSRIDFDRQSAQFELAVMVDAEHDLSISFEYATELFQAETIARFATHYLRVIEEVARAETTPLAQLSLLDAAETETLIGLGRGADLPLRADTVVDWLRPAFEEQGDRTAIVFGDRTLSYRELDRASTAVARALRRRGIGRGHRVGLHLPRSIEMLVAQLGILKSGAAYVPLDPLNPAERLQYMARDSGVSSIVVHASDAPAPDWVADIPTLGVVEAMADTIADEAAGRADVAAERDARADDPAYVLYTSGSTGAPKGVVVSHRSVVNLLTGAAVEPGLSASDRVLAVTTLGFDISVMETLLPLGAGASIVLAGGEEVGDGAALRRLIETGGVTFLQATPSTWYLLLGAGWMGSPDFKTALVGGEPLPPDLAAALLARCRDVWNMYGPTETTVWSTGGRVEDPARHGISIGRPLANTQVYVLDADLRPCPIGVEGELFIGGLGVSLGYFNRPDLTAERFLPDPFAPGDAGARLYRTGDRARFRNDGALVHLGRADSQVKIRGYRIELAEVEAALARHPQVARAAVVVRDFAAQDQRLVAYVVARGEAADGGALRAHLGRLLPDYMVPRHFVTLDALPLLGSGKVDRKALPAITAQVVSVQTPTAPRNAAEQAVWEVWRDVLGIDRFGVHENFFDLGGHSMLAVRVVNQIRAEINPSCTLPMLFQHPTIGALAAAMGGYPYVEAPSLVALRDEGEGPPLFCICGIHLYQELADQLAPLMPVYAIFVPCELGILNGDPEGSFVSVEGLAADYLAELRKKQPHGPYHLAGLSFGGLLALEIAQQLRRNGEEVAFLALFDTMVPEGRLRIAARSALHHLQMLPKDGVASLFTRGRRLVSDLISSIGRAGEQIGKPMNIADLQDAQRVALRDSIYIRASRRYKVQPYSGKAMLFRAEDFNAPDPKIRWRSSMRHLEVVRVPGDHLEILKEPNVGIVARTILDRLQKNVSSAPAIRE